MEARSRTPPRLPPVILRTPEKDALLSTVTGIKSKLSQLAAQGAEATKMIQRGREILDNVTSETAAVQAELSVLVQSPVPGGIDPTLWLPDEVLVAILCYLPYAWTVCGLVCRRWNMLCQRSEVHKSLKAWKGRWTEYATGHKAALRLQGHTGGIQTIAGDKGKIYSGSLDATIRVWSEDDGTLLQTLVGHSDWVLALALSPTGGVYSGSRDGTVRAWDDSGQHIGTMTGHAFWVSSLAVDSSGTIFSGSYDKTIRAWCGITLAHLNTLVGHTERVNALTISSSGKLYSGSQDNTIIVWLARTGQRLATLSGHTDEILSLAVGANGTVCSGSRDGTTRQWSDETFAPLRILRGHSTAVFSIAVGDDGTVYSGSMDASIKICCGASGIRRYTMEHVGGSVDALFVAFDERLYMGSRNSNALFVW